ncbi:MAG: molybdate ABC transporter substrate-binding protein [Kiloniellales bacterium]|nr:molybdate ABC transporter substrate-binding protein [Kiloniellales bacterium]
MASRRVPTGLGGVLLGLLLFCAPARAEPETVTVFAAASTTDAVTEIAALYAAKSGVAVRPVFAASSTLARQIVQGAPADLYLSANPRWMDHLAERELVAPGSRLDLLGNALVLIAPLDFEAEVGVAAGFDLAGLLDGRPLALADPDHVPAGIYAKAALTHLGVWPQAAGRTAYAANVRAALALVDRAEAAAGIVYATDVAIARNVRVLDHLPAGSHPPIRYPLAMIAGRQSAAAAAFHAFLQGPEAAARFRTRGFTLPGAGF